MDADSDVEIVSTSDAGEREELAAALAGYWEPPPRLRDASPDPLDVLDARLDEERNASYLYDQPADAQDDMDEDEPVSFGQADAYYSPLEFPDSSPEPEPKQHAEQRGDDSNAPRTSIGEDDMVLGTPPMQSSTLGEYDDAYAGGVQGDAAKDMTLRTPPRQSPLLHGIEASFPSQDGRDVEDMLQDTPRPRAQPITGQVNGPHTPDGSRPSPIVDATSHTPPRPRPPSPGHDYLGLFTPARGTPGPEVMSPLTPLRSTPSNARQDGFFSPSQRPATPVAPPPPPSAPSPPPDIPPENRYALRQRQAKQLHPYEFDKMLYKRQMRGNPEAIVKLRSPGGTERSVRPSETQEGDPDYEAPPEPVHRERAKQRREEDEDEDGRWLKEYEHLLEPPRKKRKTDDPHPVPQRVRPFPLAHREDYTTKKRRDRLKTPEQQADDAGSGDDEDEESPVLKRAATSTARVVRSPSPFNEFFDDRPRSPSPVVISSSPTHVPMDVDPNLGLVTSPTAAEDEPGNVDEEEDEEEEDEYEEDQEVDEHLRRIERKRKKALRHMWPRFMRKQEGGSSSAGEDNKENERVPPTQRRRSPSAEAPLQPGRGRMKIRHEAVHEPLVLRGDPESESEEDKSGSESSESDDGVGGAGGLIRRQRVESEHDDVIVVSSGSEAMEVRPPRHLGGAGSGRIREGDLIDRMLTRTREPRGRSKKRANEGRSTSSRTNRRVDGGGGGSGGAGGGGGEGSRHGIQVVTAQGKRSRLRQSRLEDFANPDRDANSDSDAEASRPARQPLQVMTLQGKLGQGQQATLGGGPATGDAKRKTKLPPGVWLVEGNREPSSPPPKRKRQPRRHVVRVEQQADFFAALAPSSNPAAAAAAAKPKSKPKPAPPRRAGHKHVPAADNPLVNALENVSPPRNTLFEEEARPRRLRRAATPEHERVALRLELSLNFDIPCVPSGVKFAETSYIGKGKLFELCTLVSDASIAPCAPTMCFFRGLELDPKLSFDAFCQALPTALEAVHDWIVAVAHADLEDNSGDPQVVYDFIARYFSCCARPEALFATLAEQVSAFTARVEDSIGQETTPQLLGAFWFCVEIMARVCFLPALRTDPNHVPANIQQLRTHIAQLMRRLLEFGLEATMQPIQLLKRHEDADAPAMTFQTTDCAEKALECWVCLINLVRKLPSEPDCSLGSFWDVLRVGLEDAAEGKNSYQSSELMWRAIFSICAIAQFTEHGFSTLTHRAEYGWQVVLGALKCIRLAADEKVGKPRNDQILSLRDRIIRLVVRRCFVLCAQWKWKLHEAYQVFNELARIFRSRNYGDLLGEVCDFPGFINYHDVNLLKDYEFKGDTAFAIFCKLVVLASQHLDEANEDKARASAGRRKILSLVMPMSAPAFTKASPPSGQDLSMLFNRITAVAVAFFIDPTGANAQKCVGKVKNFVNFSTADIASRKVAIRAMMHLAIMYRHFNFPLDTIKRWFAETMNVLLDEWKALNQATKSNAAGASAAGTDAKLERQNVSLCARLVLGALRTVMETPNMDPSAPVTRTYPDPQFLNGPWISHVLASSLRDDRPTCNEIRKLVQAFLDARRAFMPASARPSLKSDNVESQEADEFEFEDEDEEEYFALQCNERDEPSPDYAHRKQLDAQTCSIIEGTVEPAILDLVCARYGTEAKEGDSLDDREPRYVDREWVDCWTGCLHILVKNQKRMWRPLMEGSTWGRIIDSRWRRRVRQRFMFVVLKLNPMAYKNLGDHFVETFIQALVNVRVTWEHEFASLLFSIDGLRHPVLATVPAQRPSPEVDFQIKDTELTKSRLKFLEAIIAQIAELATAAAAAGQEGIALKRTSSRFITAIVETLHALRDLESEKPRPDYTAFCRSVRQLVKSHLVLLQNGRVAEAI